MNITSEEKCTGCMACAAICPMQCIEPTYTNEGFLYPKVNTIDCINCGKCQNICHSNVVEANFEQPETYLSWSKNDLVRNKSTSGGLFSILAEYIISLGGVVFAAYFNIDNLSCYHIEVNNLKDLDLVKKSKYIQSDLSRIWTSLKVKANQNIPILFVGTPCQVNSVKKILKGKDKSVIYVDLVCHGLMSTTLFQKSVFFLEDKYKSKRTYIDQRDKSNGWGIHTGMIKFSNGKIIKKPFKFITFGRGLYFALRKSCLNCSYNAIPRTGDITLGDYWTMRHKERYSFLKKVYDGDNGYSVVLINSDKGHKIYANVRDKVKSYKRDINEASAYNKVIIRGGAHDSYKRESFFKDFTVQPFNVIEKKYLRPSMFEYIDFYKQRLKENFLVTRIILLFKK